MWERTSYELEKIQSNILTAEEEYNSLEKRLGPTYFNSFQLNTSSVKSGIK